MPTMTYPEPPHSYPSHSINQTKHMSLKAYQSLSDRLSPLEDYQVPTLLPVRSNQFWLLHTNCIHSRPSPITPDRTGLKVSPTTPNNQDILQHRQHCSKRTKNFPGHFVLIPPIQSRQRHHPSLTTHPGPFKSAQGFVDRLSPLQDHQLCSRSTQTYPEYFFV